MRGRQEPTIQVYIIGRIEQCLHYTVDLPRDTFAKSHRKVQIILPPSATECYYTRATSGYSIRAACIIRKQQLPPYERRQYAPMPVWLRARAINEQNGNFRREITLFLNQARLLHKMEQPSVVFEIILNVTNRLFSVALSLFHELRIDISYVMRVNKLSKKHCSYR